MGESLGRQIYTGRVYERLGSACFVAVQLRGCMGVAGAALSGCMCTPRSVVCVGCCDWRRECASCSEDLGAAATAGVFVFFSSVRGLGDPAQPGRLGFTQGWAAVPLGGECCMGDPGVNEKSWPWTGVSVAWLCFARVHAELMHPRLQEGIPRRLRQGKLFGDS
jgi:hypothetical protein